MWHNKSIPTIIYELLPLLYVTSGLMMLVSETNVVAKLFSFLLFYMGVLIIYMRLVHRVQTVMEEGVSFSTS